MIKFKEIKIEGFGSIIKTLNYPLDSKGLNCVIGHNGSGKTSIFSALCWVLYGTTLKGKAEPWKEIRPSPFNGTKVSVTLEKEGIEYLVINCQDCKEVIEGAPAKSRMFLYINGKYQGYLRDKNDVKAEVQKIMGMSFELFKNTILFGQKLKRIIQETGPDKKKLFEEAFEASFINDAKVLAEGKLAEYKTRELDLFTAKENIESKIENLEASIKTYKNESKAHLEQIEILKKAQAKLDIKYSPDLKDRTLAIIKAQEEKVDRHKKASDQMFKLEITKSKYETEVLFSKASLTEILNELQRTPISCRVCGSKLDPTKIKKTKETIRARYNDKKKEIEKAKEKLEQLKNEVNSMQAKLDKYKDAKDNVRKAEKRLEAIKVYQTYQSQIKSLKSKVKESNQDKITEIEFKIDTYQKQLNQLEKESKKVSKFLGVYSWLIQKPLSNSGIKSYIFNDLLNSVNSRLLYYSSYIGFKIEFGIDLESARKDFYAVCYKGSTLVDYKELSGGQQQLVDVAIAFSIHDVVNNNHKIDLLIMDEVFESLDENNIEVISDLINLKAQDKPVFLITHRKDFSTANARVIELKLNKAGHTVVKA
jgi:DNA repair exonuclease SbcCD ATPase subunit